MTDDWTPSHRTYFQKSWKQKQMARHFGLKKKEQSMTTDYPYIRAWCRLQHSNAAFTDMELEQARKTKAPQDAIYFGEGGWKTLADIKDEVTRELIEKFVTDTQT